MRAVIQRVSNASVTVDGSLTGEIQQGLLVLLGVEQEDSNQDLEYLVDKTANLRIFSDPDGKMNLSVLDTAGSVLVVSQFTLLGDCRKGRRPSFINAADPETGNQFYLKYCESLEQHGLQVERGVFQADMQVNLTNDGPVTLILDSRKNL